MYAIHTTNHPAKRAIYRQDHGKRFTWILDTYYNYYFHRSSFTTPLVDAVLTWKWELARNCLLFLLKLLLLHKTRTCLCVCVVWNCALLLCLKIQTRTNHYPILFIFYFTDEFSVATVEIDEAIPSDVFHSIKESLELKCLLDAHLEKESLVTNI